MKRFLLLLVVSAMLTAAPALAQYVYLDTNPGADGVCNASDVLTSSVTSVDVWMDTNHNADGTPVACPDGVNMLDIFGYEIILHTTGSGSVTFGTFTNNMAGFSALPGSPTSGGGDYYVSYAGLSAFAPGLYKLGTLGVTIIGTPVLTPEPSTTLNTIFNTSFGSNCVTPGGENIFRLGFDFMDKCGTSALTPTRPTTWGAIKNLYR
ncbi:MAG TPA: hypothetical protein VID50_07970 [Candidatus Eisenbacteria bacterium]|jgi:hypothetical protein